MSRQANDVRFSQTWYDPPYPSTIAEAAAQWPQFARNAAWLHTQYPTGKIAIAGVGLGFTQYFLLMNHQRQSWGCDIAYAITRGRGAINQLNATNTIAADVLNTGQMNQFRRLGNNGQNKYDIVFTEDLLPCADSDTEAQAMLTNLRAVGNTLVHLLTPRMPNTTQDADMLWKTPEEWRALIGSTERIVLPDLTEVP